MSALIFLNREFHGISRKRTKLQKTANFLDNFAAVKSLIRLFPNDDEENNGKNNE